MSIVMGYALAATMYFLSASTALSSETGDCKEMAASFASHFFGFPEIDAESIERLMTWRASCATEPPGGKGNVFALCTAQLSSDGYVFYWRKTGVDAETSGYEICEYS